MDSYSENITHRDLCPHFSTLFQPFFSPCPQVQFFSQLVISPTLPKFALAPLFFFTEVKRVADHLLKYEVFALTHMHTDVVSICGHMYVKK